MLNKSPELKERRGYVDDGSFVRLDGSEVLKGKDWIRRKAELWARAGGKCEWKSEPIKGGVWIARWRCQDEAHDPHHIKPRSKGRDDRLANLQALCRFHHDLLDQRKIGGREPVGATRREEA